MKINFFLLFLAFAPLLLYSQPALVIKLRYQASAPEPALYCWLPTSFYSEQPGEDELHKAQLGKDSLYVFNLHTSQQRGRLILYKKKDTSLDLSWSANELIALSPVLYWEAGDEVQLTIRKRTAAHMEIPAMDDNEYFFSGKDALRYRALYEAQRSFVDATMNGGDKELFGAANRLRDPYRFKKAAAFAVINRYRRQLSPATIALFTIHFSFDEPSYRYGGIRRYFDQYTGALDAATVSLQKQRAIAWLQREANIPYPSSDLNSSIEFIRAYLRRIGLINYLLYGRDDQERSFHYMLNNVPAAYRDRLLVMLFKHTQPVAETPALYSKALKMVKDKESMTLLSTLGRSMPGAKASAFSLPDDQDSTWQLNDVKGKVVILDFWFTGCGACEVLQEKVINRLKEVYNNHSKVVFANVSVDRQKRLWKQSLKSGKYSPGNAVNLYTEGRGDAHEMIRNYNVSAYPTLIVISPGGIISRYYNGIPADQERAFQEITRDIETLSSSNR